MNVSQKFSDGRAINEYNSVAIAEGFEPSREITDQLAAWAYLIRTGMCWSLQGSFGRGANHLIQNGVISPEGEIDWNLVDEMINNQ